MGAPGRRQRWAERQNERRRTAYDTAFAAWRRDDDAARRMLASAVGFRGIPARDAPAYVQLRTGETLLWTAAGVSLLESTRQPGLQAPGYAGFSLYHTGGGPAPVATVVDTGVAAVTNRRVIFLGRHRREWTYAKLVGLSHAADGRASLMRVTNRVRVSGLSMDAGLARGFRFNVALGIAESANDRPGFVAHIQRLLGNHQWSRPQPPEPVTPQQAPLLAGFGPATLAAAAVIAVIALCTVFGLAAGRPTDHTRLSADSAPAIVTHSLSASSSTAAPVVPPSSAPVVVPAAPPAAPVAPPAVPAAPPAPTQKRTASLCGAPPNPYGYNFCGGSRSYSPPADICSYFECINNFWNGVGYMIQCKDGMVSMSGGRSGSCSYHGGNLRTVYKG
ncbi:MAG TPA: hypothetical protein VFE14_12335 [Micromonosporaceae bacterium]|jgi:hypothetical protein|nr:hypothetical protein [Micromonosporaceae bacterium]